MEKVCPCPCGERFVPRRTTQIYATSSCRARAAERRALAGTDPDGFWAEIRRLRPPRRSRALPGGS